VVKISNSEAKTAENFSTFSQNSLSVEDFIPTDSLTVGPKMPDSHQRKGKELANGVRNAHMAIVIVNRFEWEILGLSFRSIYHIEAHK
jgi:hypothetical protein